MAYTTIDDPSAYFQTALYTGNSGDNAITNDGNSDLQPDWIWVKNRGASDDHVVFDSSRGFNGDNDSLYLETNNTDAESHNDNDHLKSFNSDGFTMQGGSSRSNNNTVNFVAWQWKANGGTTTSQTGSDIDSVTQANTTSKFSIITYTGASNADSDSDNNSGAYWRVKHGLGSTPKLAIFKKRSSAAAWYVWHHKLGGTQDQKYLQLQGTNAVATESDILFGNTDWSSTEFEIGGWDVVNRDGTTYVAYMFDEVQGYSKFGSYVGNGGSSAARHDGPFVYTGFKPAWIMTKRSSSSGGSWAIVDNKRDTMNPTQIALFANTNGADDTDKQVDFLSNGFKLRNSRDDFNTDGITYVYVAFAEHPFVSSKGVPVTAK
jgi:hypothetical protein